MVYQCLVSSWPFQGALLVLCTLAAVTILSQLDWKILPEVRSASFLSDVLHTIRAYSSPLGRFASENQSADFMLARGKLAAAPASRRESPDVVAPAAQARRAQSRGGNGAIWQGKERPIWWPPVLQLGTPFFLHVPHGSAKGKGQGGHRKVRLEGAENMSRLQPSSYRPPNVAFAFASNRLKKCALQIGYENLGWPYYVIGRNYTPWDWWAKIGPLRDALESGLIKEEYIIFTDCDDMFPQTTDFRGLVDAFLFYEADIVIGGTKANWPPLEAERVFEERVSPWSKRHAHGQSSYMARTGFLLEVLRVLREPENRKQRKWFDDQIAWRKLHAAVYPRIKVDTLTRLFVRYDEFRGQFRL